MDNDEIRRIMKILADQQRRAQEALSSPGMQAFVQQVAEQQRRVQEALSSSGVHAFVQQAAEQQRRIREVLPGLAATTARMVAFMREWDEAERRILDLLAPRGWLISPDTSLTEIHELLRLADEEGVDAVEEELVRTLSPARCREMIESLYDRRASACGSRCWSKHSSPTSRACTPSPFQSG